MNEKCSCPAAITPGLDVQGITQADQIARLAYLQKETADGLTSETAARTRADEQIIGQLVAGDAANKKLIDSVDAEVGQLQSEYGTLETNVSELGATVQQHTSLITAQTGDINALQTGQQIWNVPAAISQLQKYDTASTAWVNVASAFAQPKCYSKGGLLDFTCNIPVQVGSSGFYRISGTLSILNADLWSITPSADLHIGCGSAFSVGDDLSTLYASGTFYSSLTNALLTLKFGSKLPAQKVVPYSLSFTMPSAPTGNIDIHTTVMIGLPGVG